MKGYYLIVLLSVSLLSGHCLGQSTEWVVDKVIGISEYPVLAAAARIQGKVAVTCYLNADGSVNKCRAMSGPKILTQQATNNAEMWRFQSKTKTPERRTINLKYFYELVGNGTRRKPKVQFVFKMPNEVHIISEIPCANHMPCQADPQR